MHVHTYFLHNIILTYRKLLINFIRIQKNNKKYSRNAYIKLIYYVLRTFVPYHIYFNNIYEVYHVM